MASFLLYFLEFSNTQPLVIPRAPNHAQLHVHTHIHLHTTPTLRLLSRACIWVSRAFVRIPSCPANFELPRTRVRSRLYISRTHVFTLDNIQIRRIVQRAGAEETSLARTLSVITQSYTAMRPPGLSTRNISLKTALRSGAWQNASSE